MVDSMHDRPATSPVRESRDGYAPREDIPPQHHGRGDEGSHTGSSPPEDPARRPVRTTYERRARWAMC